MCCVCLVFHCLETASNVREAPLLIACGSLRPACVKLWDADGGLHGLRVLPSKTCLENRPGLVGRIPKPFQRGRLIEETQLSGE